ncbi:MAG: RES family NAD+ phosphorylase, partial [Chitinophagales bacterium]|nr:RES family NAD+ phosphorylase [Chitinophagales bacterium]
MEVFRISKTQYEEDLSGYGAEKFGGRWNNKGNAMFYTSQSRALAMAEVAVHLAYNLLPSDFSLITLELSGSIPVYEPKMNQLPTDWDLIPFSNDSQLFGDKFIKENKYVCMKVPSV